MVLKHAVKMTYVLMLMVFSMLLFVLVFWGDTVISWAGKFMDCPDNQELHSCLGVSSVFRISFIFVCLHTLILLCCFARNSFAKVANEACFGVKMIVILLAFVGSLFIPNGFFTAYSVVTNVASGVYLLAQSISLIDFAYLWAEYWGAKFDEGKKQFGAYLIIASVIMYGSVGFMMWGMVAGFGFTGCWSNWTWLIVNISLPILWTTLILLKLNPHGSIITSGAISMFVSYLGWSSLVADTDKTCNPNADSQLYMFLQILGSFGLMIFCCFYHSVIGRRSVAYQESKIMGMNNAGDANRDDPEAEDHSEKIAPQEVTFSFNFFREKKRRLKHI